MLGILKESNMFVVTKKLKVVKSDSSDSADSDSDSDDAGTATVAGEEDDDDEIDFEDEEDMEDMEDTTTNASTPTPLPLPIVTTPLPPGISEMLKPIHAPSPTPSSSSGSNVTTLKYIEDESLFDLDALTCHACNKSFKNTRAFKLHRDRHQGALKHKCPECIKTFNGRSEVNRHMVAIHGRPLHSEEDTLHKNKKPDIVLSQPLTTLTPVEDILTAVVPPPQQQPMIPAPVISAPDLTPIVQVQPQIEFPEQPHPSIIGIPTTVVSTPPSIPVVTSAPQFVMTSTPIVTEKPEILLPSVPVRLDMPSLLDPTPVPQEKVAEVKQPESVESLNKESQQHEEFSNRPKDLPEALAHGAVGDKAESKSPKDSSNDAETAIETTKEAIATSEEVLKPHEVSEEDKAFDALFNDVKEDTKNEDQVTTEPLAATQAGSNLLSSPHHDFFEHGSPEPELPSTPVKSKVTPPSTPTRPVADEEVISEIPKEVVTSEVIREETQENMEEAQESGKSEKDTENAQPQRRRGRSQALGSSPSNTQDQKSKQSEDDKDSPKKRRGRPKRTTETSASEDSSQEKEKENSNKEPVKKASTKQPKVMIPSHKITLPAELCQIVEGKKGKKMYQCQICSNEFKRKDIINYHVYNEHREEFLECGKGLPEALTREADEDEGESKSSKGSSSNAAAAIFKRIFKPKVMTGNKDSSRIGQVAVEIKPKDRSIDDEDELRLKKTRPPTPPPPPKAVTPPKPLKDEPKLEEKKLEDKIEKSPFRPTEPEKVVKKESPVENEAKDAELESPKEETLPKKRGRKPKVPKQILQPPIEEFTEEVTEEKESKDVIIEPTDQEEPVQPQRRRGRSQALGTSPNNTQDQKSKQPEDDKDSPKKRRGRPKRTTETTVSEDSSQEPESSPNKSEPAPQKADLTNSPKLKTLEVALKPVALPKELENLVGPSKVDEGVKKPEKADSEVESPKPVDKDNEDNVPVKPKKRGRKPRQVTNDPELVNEKPLVDVKVDEKPENEGIKKGEHEKPVIGKETIEKAVIKEKKVKVPKKSDGKANMAKIIEDKLVVKSPVEKTEPVPDEKNPKVPEQAPAIEIQSKSEPKLGTYNI